MADTDTPADAPSTPEPTGLHKSMAKRVASLRVAPGDGPKFAKRSPDDDLGLKSKEQGLARLAELQEQLRELQSKLWAENRQSLLIVLQAPDAAGKDGTIRSVFTGVNPMGVRVESFKVPTGPELEHDYLWRVHQRVPEHGHIVLFNRSHYEDVLVVRVEEIVPKKRWKKRYDHIAAFEQMLVDEGTTIVKLYLDISKEEQAARFAERKADPAKQWKYNAGDEEVQAKWDSYREAYAEAIKRTSTDDAPWYVIPSNAKWVRNVAVAEIMVQTLTKMKPSYPAATPPEG
jgi:PPK2 family polyphosphate:nucleotide phosphotransferase